MFTIANMFTKANVADIIWVQHHKSCTKRSTIAYLTRPEALSRTRNLIEYMTKMHVRWSMTRDVQITVSGEKVNTAS